MHNTLRKGDSGPEVGEMQALLVGHGFLTEVDGIFGPSTESTVKSFQESAGLKPDGICGTNTWAALESSPDISSLPLNWESVASLLPEFYQQRYLLSGAQCPSNPPGVSLKRIGYETTNCVLFTSWLVSAAFSGVRFSGDQWSRWMVSSANNDAVPRVPGYGPSVALDWGIATTAPGPGVWLIQYFTELAGHSLIVVDHDEETDKILTLEAIGDIEGAGWGQIGPLRLVENPGPDWKDKVRQTWAGRIGKKKAVHMVRLLIDPKSVASWLESA